MLQHIIGLKILVSLQPVEQNGNSKNIKRIGNFKIVEKEEN
ncbi:hypothetical protein MSIBF_A2020005 [groundwater metagenome]|uniref:Uncharacterized protein n=1 Tax=groundwater metagenome TaxID=717931 RepID=A0A098E844_9ZZZZ